MKRIYKEPVIVIELFQDPDVIVCSSGEIPGEEDGFLGSKKTETDDA